MTTDPLGAPAGRPSSRRQGLSCLQPHQRGLYAVAVIVLCSVSYTFRHNQPLTVSDRALGSSSPVSSSLPSNTLRSAATTTTATATSQQSTTTYETLATTNVPAVSTVVIAPKLGVSPSDEAYCRHGGLELDNGRCICGRGTQGLRCQTVNASLLAKVQDHAVCGPGACLAGFYVEALPPPSLYLRCMSMKCLGILESLQTLMPTKKAHPFRSPSYVLYKLFSSLISLFHLLPSPFPTQ